MSESQIKNEFVVCGSRKFASKKVKLEYVCTYFLIVLFFTLLEEVGRITIERILRVGVKQ